MKIECYEETTNNGRTGFKKLNAEHAKRKDSYLFILHQSIIISPSNIQMKKYSKSNDTETDHISKLLRQPVIIFHNVGFVQIKYFIYNIHDRAVITATGISQTTRP